MWVQQWLLLLVASASALGRPAVANVGAAQESQRQASIRSELALLESANWPERSHGFFELVHMGLGENLNGRSRLIPSALARLIDANPESAEAIRIGLIRLLEKENAFALRESTTEEYAAYRGDLVAAVAALHDPRALDALLGVIANGSLAVQGIAAIGPSALDRVIPLSTSPEVLVRNGATQVIARIAATAGSDPTVLPRATEALLARLKDPERFVRISAVRGLAGIPGDRVTNALRLTAQTDPFYLVNSEGKTSYPVREEATKALLTRPKQELR